MTYVDGFVLAVPTANKEKYLAMAHEAWPMFKEFGATRMVECWGDDVPDGQVTSFAMAVKAEPNETIMFSWIEWPSKEARDAGHAKMMEQGPPTEMPFDGMRMIWAGFVPVLDEKASPAV